MTTAHIETLLDRFVGDGMTPEDAVEAAIAGTPFEEIVELVRPLLVWRARGRLRAMVRHVEQRQGSGSPERRRELVRHAFALPDGVWVAWGEATADQHRARAGWQRQHASACVADAERHEQAAAAIEAAGVSCLNEIDEVA